jgi:hypothetical protein
VQGYRCDGRRHFHSIPNLNAVDADIRLSSREMV